MKLVAGILTGLLLSTAGSQPVWVEEVFDYLQHERKQAGANPLERRALIDAAATTYAERVAALAHAERTTGKPAFEGWLKKAGVKHYRLAAFHIDMGLGYSDWGDKFRRSWTEHASSWKNATNSQFDAIGMGTATGADDWVVFVTILVDELETSIDPRVLERRVAEEVNAIRVEHGLKPLKHHERLAMLARFYSGQLARHHYFSHTGIDGTTLDERAKRRGIKFQAIGENLAANEGHDDPLRVAVEGWMNSPGHRKNILSRKYSHTAVGVAFSDDGRTVFTQLFLLPTSLR